MSQPRRCIGWVGRKSQNPKKEGGLGIQIANGRNTTLLAKLKGTMVFLLGLLSCQYLFFELSD